MKATALYAAQSAGKILLDHFGKLSEAEVVRDYKRDFTTKTDLEAERAILKILKKKTPTYNIITEEAGTDQRFKSPFTWVIDPLDGTTNYSIGNPFFDVSIALMKGREPILAVVYAPIIDWMFVAEKGKGTTLNNIPIRVSNKSKPESILAAFCRGNDDKHIKKINKITSRLNLKVKDMSRMRAAAYELALIANGKLGAFAYTGVKPWDVAAGVLLVREAGGKATDFAGKNWDLDSADLLATNGKVHKELLTEINNSLKK